MTIRVQNRSRRLWIVVGSLCLLCFALGPFVWMLLVSFTSRPDLILTGEASYSIANYVNVLTSSTLHFGAYFRNSLIVGYLYKMFAHVGLLNTHLALILPYMALTVSLALWICMSYFAQIPPELDEAAHVDGAGRWTILLKVILPIALPGIFAAFMLVFIACFNEFLFALMLTLDDRAQTLPVGIAMFEGLHGEVPWGNLMAASSLATLPLVVLTVIFQRFIVQGLTGGAVKG